MGITPLFCKLSAGSTAYQRCIIGILQAFHHRVPTHFFPYLRLCAHYLLRCTKHELERPARPFRGESLKGPELIRPLHLLPHHLRKRKEHEPVAPDFSCELA